MKIYVVTFILAAVLSALPSTYLSYQNGEDYLESSRVLGSILVDESSDDYLLIGAAGLIHLWLSFVWTVILVKSSEHLGTSLIGHIAWAVASGYIIAIFDVCFIAQIFFPAVAALPFGPILLDHFAFTFLVMLATWDMRMSE